MKVLLKLLLITLFTCSFWLLVFTGMLMGGGCISARECAIHVFVSIMGFLLSGFGIAKIERM